MGRRAAIREPSTPASYPVSPDQAPVRDRSIDIARGIAIMAIVLGHVLRGLGSAGIVDPTDPGITAIDRSLYLFHLAAFALLAGLFVRASTTKSGAAAYARSRISQFLYLYLLWSVLQGTVKLVTAHLVNDPVTVWDVLNLTHPDGQLWFLPWLIVASGLTAALRPWRNRPLTIASIVVAAGISLYGWGSDPGIIGLQGAGIIFFFLIGVLCGSRRATAALAWLTLPRAIAAAIVLTATFLAIGLYTPATPPTALGHERTVASTALGIAGAVIGVAALLATSRALAFSAALARPLSFVGKRSLEIFLASIIFASGSRVLLRTGGILDPLLHTTLGTLAGVAGPILFWWLLGRLHFPWLFTAPVILTGARSGPARTYGRHRHPSAR
jgi:fucose 4-O-acetylase-like acetyltransferase